MRILLAIGSLDVGGSETQLVRLARELKDRGHEVRVFTLTGGALEATLKEQGIVHVQLTSEVFIPKQPRVIWAISVRAFKEIRAFAPHVTHAFLFWGFAFFVPMSWAAGVRVRISARRGLTDPGVSHPLLRLLRRAADIASTAVTVNAQAIARQERSAVHVIGNGVDIPGEVAKPEIEPPKGLMIANLISYKGHVDLIQALGQMTKPPRIKLIGEGPERSAIEAAIKEAALTDTVTLEGAIPNAATLWTDAQFGLLCSHEEGMPNAILEAMAAGVPMIATAVGGSVELVDDGVTGLLVPPRDPASLAAAIEKMTTDANMRAKMGEAARAKAANYSWSKCTDAYENLYRNLLR